MTAICAKCKYHRKEYGNHSCNARPVVDFVTGEIKECWVECYDRNISGNCKFFEETVPPTEAPK